MKRIRLFTAALLFSFVLAAAGGSYTDRAYGKGSRDRSVSEDSEEKSDMIEFWREDSEAASSIMEFVSDAVDLRSDGYIPVEDRIAVFDLDGTIFCETYPSSFEYMMFIHRALYDDSYQAPEGMKEFARRLEEGIEEGELPKNCGINLARYAGEAYEGMSIDELKEYTQDFMDSRAEGFEELMRGDAFYKPMVSLMEYLKDNDFECYIVSDTDRTVIRALIKDKLPVPESRVIGRSYVLEASGQLGDDGQDYQYTAEDEVIFGTGPVSRVTNMNKVSVIADEIGKVPVLAFGNSTEDLSMARYTVNNKDYEGRAYIVLCDDTEREHGDMDRAEELKAECEELEFGTISMHDDFETIYGMDVRLADEAGEGKKDKKDSEEVKDKEEKKDSEADEDKKDKKDKDSEEVRDKEDKKESEAGEGKKDKKDSEEVKDKEEKKDSEAGEDKKDKKDSEEVKDKEEKKDNEAGEDKKGNKDNGEVKDKEESEPDNDKDAGNDEDALKNREGSADIDKADEKAGDDDSSRDKEEKKDDNKTEADPEKEKKNEKFTEKKVQVYKDGEPKETLTVRYYEGQPDVPYIGIRAYYDCFMEDSLDDEKVTMSVNRAEDGGYILTNPYGEAYADVEADILKSDDMRSFTNLMSLVSPGLDNCYYDGIPYVRVEKVKTIGDGEKTYDLGKYDIEIYGDENDVYFPESTLSDIFSDLSFHYSAFNGESIYFNMLHGETAFDEKEFNRPILDSLDAELNRPADLADFAFNELCFSVENLYGFPGRAIINDEINEVGLEEALMDYGGSGKKTVELLRSPNMPEYLYGLSRLELFLYDGHTSFVNEEPENFDSDELREQYKKLEEELEPLYQDVVEEAKRHVVDPAVYFSIRRLRNKSYNGEKYIKDGDTAVFVLDSFNGTDRKAWEDYYNGSGVKPTSASVSGDDILLFRDALKDADKDPDIRNFVIDCSNNTGGSLDEAAMLYCLITGERKVKLRMEDSRTGQRIDEMIAADTDLDREFDEYDEREPYDLNFAVLTSSISFSGGNLFPELMREAGYMILGERSGGGSCAVMKQTTGEGLSYQLSSCHARFIDQDGNNIDNGVPVDCELIPQRSDGSSRTILVEDVLISGNGIQSGLRVPDYSDFYDIDRLSEEIGAFYDEIAE